MAQMEDQQQGVKPIDEWLYLVLVGVSWNTAESNFVEEFIVTQFAETLKNQQLGFLRDHI